MKATFSIIGNLCRDPETRTTANGTSVVNVSIACNRKTKKGDRWEDEVSFFNLTLFGKKGEACAKFMKKGNRAGFDGYMRQESWETQDGQKRHKTGFIATEMYFLTSKAENDNNSADTEDDFNDGLDENDQVPF